VEGHNITFEWRFVEADLDQLPARAAELVHQGVDLIVAMQGLAIRAAQDATHTIPIVMAGTGDPVKAGFVASLAAPGGSITGVSTLRADLNAKRLELLKEAVPGASRVAVLADPATPYTPGMEHEMEPAAQALGIQLHILEVPEPSALEPAFAALTTARVDALMVLPAARFWAHRRRIVARVADRKLPAIYEAQGFVQAGGLMSYSESLTERLRRVATYVDKILNGAKPADLPIEQPTTFELVINVKTAQVLGLTMPPSLLFQATEVIR